MDRRQPEVPGTGAIASMLLEVVEEGPHERRVEIADLECGRGLAGLRMGEAEQETERVAVSRYGVGAHVTLSDEPVGEERLKVGSETAHESHRRRAPADG